MKGKTMKIVKKRVIKEHIVEDVRRVCDLCGKTAAYTCHLCGRDICRGCHYFDYRFSGDYPDTYCRQCWGIGKTYRDKMKRIENDADKLIEKQNALWRQMALDAAKQTSQQQNYEREDND